MSPKSAGLAVQWGHKNPLVYVDGLPAWKKAGHQVMPELEYLEKGNIVILDIRERKQAKGGSLPKAYSIPLEDLEDADEILPANRGVPLYLYGSSDDDVKAGVKIVKSELGYKNVIGLYGILDAWKAAGKELAKGSAKKADEENPIIWKKKLGEGEISIEDFTDSLQSKLIYVIDARTPAEYESGHFPGAVSLPLEEMQSRMKEIPKDKFIVVHCKTGGRGEIGYHLLKKNGYAVKFLNAECECALSGEYEIW